MILLYSSSTAVLPVFSKKITCLPQPEAYTNAVKTVCKSDTACADLLAAGQEHFYSCLNGNNNQPGDEGSCYEFAQTVLPSDPHMLKVSNDIVLWSGLTPTQQENFHPKTGHAPNKVPLLLGVTWGSKVTAAFQTFDWDNQDECLLKTTATKNQCVDDCGWDQDSTLKPWEALSRWLAEHAAKASMSHISRKQGAAKVYLLLNYFSNANVFSRIELPTVVASMYRESKKLLNIMRTKSNNGPDNVEHKSNDAQDMKDTYNNLKENVKAGVQVLSIRIAKNAVDRSPNAYDSDGNNTPITRPPGVPDPPLTCATVIQFVEVVEAREKEKLNDSGNAMLCVRCFDECDPENFLIQSSGGMCEEKVKHHCLRKKLVKAVKSIKLLKNQNKLLQPN